MANRIREIRKSKGMTLLQLAERLGVSESTVQRYESGNIKNLKYETMTDLSIIFNCSPSYLMGWDEKIIDADFKIELSNEELLRIKKERSLNGDGIKALRSYLDYLLSQDNYTVTIKNKKISG